MRKLLFSLMFIGASAYFVSCSKDKETILTEEETTISETTDSTSSTTDESSDNSNDKSDESNETESKEIQIQTITFNENQEKLVVGRPQPLSVTISPENASNQKLKWESDNPDVIRVDQEGNVYASSKSAGKRATITASATDGSNVKAEITITSVQLTQSLNITLGNHTLMVGAELTLEVEVSPANASTFVAWSSSDSDVISVDAETGKIKCLKEGRSTITAQATDGSAITHFIEIKVITNADQIRINRDNDGGLTVKQASKSPITLNLSYNNTVTGTINSQDDRRKFLRWTSSDSKTAYVNEKLELIAVKKGSVTIKVTYEDGRDDFLEDSIQVTITE